MRRAGVRSAVGLAATVLALLGLPATGQASTQFGSNLTGGNGAVFACDAACTLWNSSLPAADTAGTLSAPADGVITSYTLKDAGATENAWASVHLRVARTQDGGKTWSGLGASFPDVTPTADGSVQTFVTRVPVGAGDFIGLETLGGQSIRAGLANPMANLNLLIGDAFPHDGSSIPPDSNIPSALALRATLEPDADRDGFGDETQDRSKGPKEPAACAPSRATIVGTIGPDALTGTPGRDVILGLSGRDSIRGLGGADVICGHDGRDLIKGGAGRDRLIGGAGADRVVGGAGRDQCTVFDPRC
jgi:hypothetical protein